jgi:hypothetical protein
MAVRVSVTNRIAGDPQLRQMTKTSRVRALLCEVTNERAISRYQLEALAL